MPDQVVDGTPIWSSRKFLARVDAETIPAFVLSVLIVYAAVRSICQAATRPFWFDEVSTFLMVHQPISGIWNSLMHGADGQPPGFYVAERFAASLVANESVAFRLLSILGFLSTVLCLYFLIRKRHGSTVALLCSSIPLVTVLYDNFAVESRPYSIVVACISFALICYERAPTVRWMVLMGLSLTLAEAFHYYAVFAFVPFVVSEAVLLIAQRRVRPAVWLALSCGFIPLLAFWPLLSISKVLYGQHFWAQPSLEGTEFSYSFYLRTSFSNGIALVASAALAVLGTMLYVERRGTWVEDTNEARLQEPLMILTFLSLPFVAYIATKLAHGGMTPRYVLSSILGFPLAVSYILPKFRKKSLVLVSAFSVFLLVFLPQEITFWSSYSSHFSSPSDPVEALASSVGHENLPIVVSYPLDFTVLEHYASPQWTRRFVMLVDAPNAFKYAGSDTLDKLVPVMADCFSLPVYDYQTFAAEHPVFLLYSSQGGTGYDWWPRKLSDDGYTLRPVAAKMGTGNDYVKRVFLVSRMKGAD